MEKGCPPVDDQKGFPAWTVRRSLCSPSPRQENPRESVHGCRKCVYGCLRQPCYVYKRNPNLDVRRLIAGLTLIRLRRYDHGPYPPLRHPLHIIRKKTTPLFRGTTAAPPCGISAKRFVGPSIPTLCACVNRRTYVFRTELHAVPYHLTFFHGQNAANIPIEYFKCDPFTIQFVKASLERTLRFYYVEYISRLRRLRIKCKSSIHANYTFCL